MEDNDMLLPISEVAKRTGVSVNTIRAWANGHELGEDGAEQREMPAGPAWWYATVKAVEIRAAKEHRTGRKLIRRKSRA